MTALLKTRTVSPPAAKSNGQQVVLHDVPWRAYETICDALPERYIRMTYDRGELEIMTVSDRHERYKALLGVLILIPADWWGSSLGYYPKPRLAVDHLLMIVKHAANGISEELVTRAYLISRLQQVLGSTTAAVVISAVFFASYHLYQGLSGLVFVMMFGLAYGLVFVMIRRLWPLAFGHMAYNVYIELA